MKMKRCLTYLENNKVALRAYNYYYVKYVPEDDGLAAYDSEIDNQAIFTFVEIDSGGFVLRNYLNKYIGIGAKDMLMANKESVDEAAHFFINKIPGKKYTSFSFNRLIPLITGLLLIFISIIMFQYKEDEKLSIILLLLGGLSVRIFTALLNPFLNMWDEQFHALVAKNMMNNPFEPMLYKNPVLAYSDMNWAAGHIWLHKQPL